MDIKEYFEYEYLNQLAIDEKIYYSPSVGWDKINSKRVNINRDVFLKHIVNRVLSNSYTFTPYKVNLLIKNKDCKPRKTCIPTVKDRIVICAIKRYLYDFYRDERFNNPANQIIREITQIIESKEKIYYKKIDLSAFFDNINHQVLIGKISKKVNEKIIINLIKNILENPQKCDETDKKIKNVVGVPQGISIATLFSNIYMHDFDTKYANKKDISYFRYVDDIIVFSKDKNEIDNIYAEMKYDLERVLLLPVNMEKTKDGYIEEGLEYLGYKFDGDIITVRKSSITKFERNIEKVFKNFSVLKEKDETQIKKFIWLLNVKITGILVDEKKYGWLYYFSCINDKSLLKRLDLLVEKFIKRFKIESFISIKDIKKFTKTYYEIKNNIKESKYLLNLNNVEKEEKKKFLKEICLNTNVDRLTDEELDYRYRYNLYRTLKNLERDIDSVSG